MEEFYFCLYLTSSEHEIIEWELKKKCEEFGCSMLYYRQLKDGHWPMYREVKIVGSKPQLGQLNRYMEDQKLPPEKNPYKTDEYKLGCSGPNWIKS